MRRLMEHGDSRVAAIRGSMFPSGWPLVSLEGDVSRREARAVVLERRRLNRERQQRAADLFAFLSQLLLRQFVRSYIRLRIAPVQEDRGGEEEEEDEEDDGNDDGVVANT